MPIYNSPIDPKQITQSRLIEPHRLVFKANIQPNRFIRFINNNLIFGLFHTFPRGTSTGFYRAIYM